MYHGTGGGGHTYIHNVLYGSCPVHPTIWLGYVGGGLPNCQESGGIPQQGVLLSDRKLTLEVS